MINLYDAVSLSKRKRVAIFILIITMWCLIIYVFHQNPEHSLFLSMKISGILLSFILTWMMMDMTHPFEMMIRSYKGNSYLIFYKWLSVIIWSFVFTLSTSLMITFYALLSHQEGLLVQYYKLPIHLFLDLLMIGGFVMMISKIKHPTLALLTPLFYTTYQLFIENQTSLYLYYLFPFFQPMILDFKLAISYKLCYISLGLLITNFPRQNN